MVDDKRVHKMVKWLHEAPPALRPLYIGKPNSNSIM